MLGIEEGSVVDGAFDGTREGLRLGADECGVVDGVWEGIRLGNLEGSMLGADE